MALLLPAALASLLAVLIPLAIHLARRSEAVPTDFAALRWLRQKPRPKSRIRFDEWPLLIARLILLTLIAIWLARPILPGSADTTPVVAALPGVNAGPPAKGSRNIWLADGFPPATEPQPTCLSSPLPPAGEARDPSSRGPGEGSSLPSPLPSREKSDSRLREPGEGAVPNCPNISSLIRQLDSELAPGVPLTIIVPQILQGTDPQRPHLSRPITWKIAPGEMPTTTPPPAKFPHLSIRQPTGLDRGQRTLRAAAAAWTARASYDITPPNAPLPTPPTILVWLTPGPLPTAVRDWITAGGTALVTNETPAEPTPAITLWRDPIAAPLAEGQTLGKGRFIRFTRPLTPAQIPQLRDPDFPHQLAALLGPPAQLPSRIAAENLAPSTGAPPWPQPARDLQPWLALLIALAFITERWLATRRTRAVAP
ncbi:hypothetical protein GCM10011529_06900 [Polymorphobacter glacialis]|uniref:Aerotolerance regulator N-terminal domain-containing protein n=1 Tax=Sandarakinorhabdus glacialis TaxID=1614636 RepID=A0A916ZM66_9SPHN|nr:BatA domain-containing protein [Polymorphobacter glacialis]GGE03068.1 hypothetical protein GCM10011529_06900 [Polymorphobacter glacialis]